MLCIHFLVEQQNEGVVDLRLVLVCRPLFRAFSLVSDSDAFFTGFGLGLTLDRLGIFSQDQSGLSQHYNNIIIT